jgi:hypothetical protein
VKGRVVATPVLEVVCVTERVKGLVVAIPVVDSVRVTDFV